MESGRFPKINVKGIGILRPVPKFIKLKIDSMLKKGNPDMVIIEKLQEAFKKETLIRDRKKRNKNYRKYESG